MYPGLTLALPKAAHSLEILGHEHRFQRAVKKHFPAGECIPPHLRGFAGKVDQSLHLGLLTDTPDPVATQETDKSPCTDRGGANFPMI